MKSLVLLLLLIGITFMIIGYVKTNQQCPPPIIKYRYIPRTFKNEQENPIPLYSIFGSMFTNSSPWQEYVGYSSEFNDNSNTTSNTSSLSDN